MVAKLYHRPLNADKQSKLRYMISRADSALSSYAAWPSQTLHTKSNGPVVGFLMPTVGGRYPIHMLYSPAHRKQEFPTASWEFLLCAARNTAAAFETLHTRGHVLGDVNQGNVMVGRDSRIVLIDCDSYQVQNQNTTYFCEVGVSHFTPPELQSISSFHGVKRTANHDAFGLALLVFHLLFGGRHPYSGVPLRRDVGESLEGDIRAFRYAYAADAAQRGLAPPPGSIPISVASDVIRRMFETAFLEQGSQQSRPTAQQWVAVLDEQRRQLRRCGQMRIHIFPQHLNTCPWCALDAKGVCLFISVEAFVPGAPSNFVLVRVWAAIDSVKLAPTTSTPDFLPKAVEPTPLPGGMLTRAQRVGFAFMVALVAASLCLALRPWSWAFLIAGVVVATIPNWSPGRGAERKRRQTAHDVARNTFNTLRAQYRAEQSTKLFNDKKSALVQLRDEYVGLDQRQAKELADLKNSALNRQRQKYLDGFFIEGATIKGVGPAKKAALRSFGIETAADVEWSKVSAVRGFGPSNTSAMIAWRKKIEAGFKFDPRTAVLPSDEASVRARVYSRKRAIEAILNNGAAELIRAVRELSAREKMLLLRIQSAETAWNQARADLSLL
jgi:DNA-binding helix-hairpin-helix protein with protein kinase domain